MTMSDYETALSRCWAMDHAIALNKKRLLCKSTSQIVEDAKEIHCFLNDTKPATIVQLVRGKQNGH